MRLLGRDGSEASRDPRTGDVLAEIIVKDTSGDPSTVLASYSSPWPLGKKRCVVSYDSS